MSAKAIVLIRKRADLSIAAFREAYEQEHVPLVMRLLGHFFSDYRRNYLAPGQSRAIPGHASGPADWNAGFDCVTEMWFADVATMEAMFAFASSPDVYRQLHADQERFMDRRSIRNFIVAEAAMPALGDG
jgi:hypothetical protein